MLLPSLLLLVHMLGVTGSSPAERAVQLQQQIDAAIASRAPATIELSGTYNFNRSSLLIIGSTSQLTLRPSPSCVAPGCVPELLFSIGAAPPRRCRGTSPNRRPHGGLSLGAHHAVHAENFRLADDRRGCEPPARARTTGARPNRQRELTRRPRSLPLPLSISPRCTSPAQQR
jgi:hypothetical protein